ncbi:ABC transporter substrate-binding protein [Aureimonas populi]|uniref:ABC transporter substrate-binding protein n=1 Tax=Aureimonas populi TaxID=1701758 RepID=A0ABW5CMJ9_9HYPH|nr:ABC transporter substrate-binding protein [Aureimonas populi]
MPRRVLLLSLLLAAASGPAAAQAYALGVAAPLSGPSAILGEQMVAGAAAAAGTRATVVAADTECSAEGGEVAARVFVQERVDAVIGFLCTPAIEAALPVLTQAGIPVVDVGVRANRLTNRRDRTGHLVWRLAPRSDAEADAIAAFVRENWRTVPFGIVEDGSVQARDLADEVRARLGPESIEPALVDNYRPAEEVQFPLARRILQSGVTRFLAFGSRQDIAILQRDAGEIGLELEIVGGEQLVDEPGETDIAAGTRALGIFDEAPEAGQRIEEGYHRPARAATEIALGALDAASGSSFAEAMQQATFPTVLGPISFDGKGDSSRRAFELREWNGEAFVPVPQS